MKPEVVLIGGLNGARPAGREMLIRLARHLVTGKLQLACCAFFWQVLIVVSGSITLTGVVAFGPKVDTGWAEDLMEG